MHQTMTSKLLLVTLEHDKNYKRHQCQNSFSETRLLRLVNSKLCIFEILKLLTLDVLVTFENFERSTRIYFANFFVLFLISPILITQSSPPIIYSKTTPRRLHQPTSTPIFNHNVVSSALCYISNFIHCKSEILLNRILMKRNYSINFIILFLSLLS